MLEKSYRDWSWAKLRDWSSGWYSPDSKTRTAIESNQKNKENLDKRAVKSIATVLTVKQITKGESNGR